MLVLGLGRPELRCALTDASARRAIPAESRGPQLRLFASPPASGGAYELPELQEGDRPGFRFLFLVQRFRAVVGQGRKANLFRRCVALALDPLIAVVLYLLGVGIVGSISKDLGIVAAIGLPIVYLVWFLGLFRQGLTPGKKLLGLQVVDHQTGAIPGFGKMFVREIVGRFISGLFFGLGYFWAIFDKNSQAWHDKIAGTVVLKLPPRAVPAATAPRPATAR